MSTKIEWTDEVWNPVTGCDKVSQGCKNCYAERIAERFWGERKFTDVQCHPERLDIPLHWRKPRRVFVNSMSDLFHEDVTDEFITEVWNVMHDTPQHIYQILTKRPERMQWLTHQQWGDHLVEPNVWLGVSCEDQKTAYERIPLLLQAPAAVRFVSLEPLLGPIDLLAIFGHDLYAMNKGLDWVIVGGESGPHARPMHPDWARSIRDQCVEAGVPFFFKQVGEWATVEEFGTKRELGILRVGKKKAGRLLDGREWNEFPASRPVAVAEVARRQG